MAILLPMLLGGSAQAAEAPWHTYSDPAHNLSISYPDGWKVDPNFADKGYRYMQGDPDDVRYGIGLSPTVDLAPGTNLESRSLVLAIQFARPGDLCKASAFLADPSPDYFTQVLEDTPDLAHTRAEPGDLYIVERIVHIASRSPCVALQIYLVSDRIRAGDPNKPAAFDRPALFHLLSSIAVTLKPLK
ncbi:MAG: hypothetical protein WDN08_10995 [Rhizomicrobium sp.]